MGARPRARGYPLLLDAAAQTLLRFGRERLGGTLGVTMVLHTWGQRLNSHPHVHAIVTDSALAADGRWRPNHRRGFLFPVRALGAVFRGKSLAGLTALMEKDAVPVPPGGWSKLWRTPGQAKWVVYCKRPFAGPEQVLSYLSQYTHRVAISERRIEAFDPAAQTVTFRWRAYAADGALTYQLDKEALWRVHEREGRYLLRTNLATDDPELTSLKNSPPCRCSTSPCPRPTAAKCSWFAGPNRSAK